MKKKMKLLYIFVAIITILSVTLIGQNIAKAGGMSAINVTMRDGSSQTISTANTAVVSTAVVLNPDGNVNTDDGIKINFQSDFDISDVVNGDVALAQANGGTNITKGTASVSGQNLLIPVDTESDTPSGQITVTITGSHITTPTTPGTYKITVTTWDLGDDGAFGGAGADADTQEDEGTAAVIIGTNQVTITGTVDPSLTLTLSGNTCALGTLSASNIQTCNYNTTVSTNGTSGYSATIKDDGNLRNATNDINDVSGGTVNDGTEAYGIATSKASQTITRVNDADADENYDADDCTTMDGGTTHANGSALTTSDQTFASASGPISSDVTYLCQAASIAGSTPAGSYASIVTITVVGNF